MKFLLVVIGFLNFINPSLKEYSGQLTEEDILFLKEQYNWNGEEVLLINYNMPRKSCHYNNYMKWDESAEWWKGFYAEIDLFNVKNIFVHADVKRASIAIDSKKHFADKDHYFFKNFFSVEMTCDGLLVIDSTGKYYQKNGEYTKEEIRRFLHNITLKQGKTVKYVDRNYKEIPFEVFNTYDRDRVFVKTIEKDSLIIKAIKYKRKKVKLDSVQLHQVKNLLYKITKGKVDYNKPIMIHYFSESGKVLNDAFERKRYWNYVKRNSHKLQSFLIGAKGLNEVNHKKRQLYIDDYNILKTIFFSHTDFKINHVYLKPNGEAFIHFGNEDILAALDGSI